LKRWLKIALNETLRDSEPCAAANVIQAPSHSLE